jgi:GT2 family glycosyltransferase
VRASIVVTTYNSAPYIRTQLDAIARQQPFRDVEVVVSDNGSIDDTLQIVAAYRDRFPRCMIVDSSDARGVAHAKNVGASAASGDSILFVDDDDEVGDGWLGAMLDALGGDPFVAARLEHHRLNPPWTIAYRGEPQADGLAGSNPPFLPHAFACSIGIRRSLHDAVGGFDESMLGGGEDNDYCYRIELLGTELRFVPSAIVHYRHRRQLAAIYRQSRGYGQGAVELLNRYRQAGMRRPPAWRAFVSWLLIVPRLPLESLSVAGRARWFWRLGWRVGRLEASIRSRIFAP